MSIECAYSFADLYRAAHGREASAEELQKLHDLEQPQRNNIVASWAMQAGWQTESRTGSDGKLYLAFWPKDPEIKQFLKL